MNFWQGIASWKISACLLYYCEERKSVGFCLKVKEWSLFLESMGHGYKVTDYILAAYLFIVLKEETFFSVKKKVWSENDVWW